MTTPFAPPLTAPDQLLPQLRDQGFAVLGAASVAALTIYDMCKAVQKDMVIEQVRLVEKKGGKSGHFQLGASAGEQA